VTIIVEEEEIVKVVIFGTQVDLNGVWDDITKTAALICANNTNHDIGEYLLMRLCADE
jgi:hypothetical protein